MCIPNFATIVGSNVSVPHIKVTWVGSLNWRTALNALIGGVETHLIVRGTFWRQSERRGQQTIPHLLFTWLSLLPLSWFQLLLLLPPLIPKPGWPGIHHGLKTRNLPGFRCSLRLLRYQPCGLRKCWMVSLSSENTAAMGPLSWLRPPSLRVKKLHNYQPLQCYFYFKVT